MNKVDEASRMFGSKSAPVKPGMSIKEEFLLRLASKAPLPGRLDHRGFLPERSKAPDVPSTDPEVSTITAPHPFGYGQITGLFSALLNRLHLNVKGA